jgi:molybdenum cofactor cytidylyltransferase
MSGIGAVVLAAGESRRMGEPKLLLPWGKVSVLGHIIQTLRQAGIEDVLVVTGAWRERVEKEAVKFGARLVHNEIFASGGMLSSIQCGLRAQLPETRAALICLGDQPQMQAEVVRAICDAYRQTQARVVIPSYANRRGHPWLAEKGLWQEILHLPPDATPRAFLSAHAKEILYVSADPSILLDLDTPEDYQQQRPEETR